MSPRRIRFFKSRVSCEQIALRTSLAGCGTCWCPLSVGIIKCPLLEVSGLNPASGCGTCCSNGIDANNYCCPTPTGSCDGSQSFDNNGCKTCTCSAGINKVTKDCCSTKQVLCAMGLVRGVDAITGCTTCCAFC